MGEGAVDINWAEEHHNLWLEEVRAGSQPHLAQEQAATTPGE
jgi:cytochrome b subunit of formate dehydrogenase